MMQDHINYDVEEEEEDFNDDVIEDINDDGSSDGDDGYRDDDFFQSKTLHNVMIKLVL